jgi:rubrerythrin
MMTKLQYVKWFKKMLKEEKEGVREYTKLYIAFNKDAPSIANEFKSILDDEKRHVRYFETLLSQMR